MLNTVAFIESIEPDFEYQGLEGAMSLVVENAENFAIINDVIDESAEIAEEEAFTEGVIGSTAKFVRKAIEWIIKNIKKAIAKLKSLFLSLVHKLKMAYLSAMRSIGKFAAKNLVGKNAGTVKVKWYKLNKEQFKSIVNNIGEQIKKRADDLKDDISTDPHNQSDDELRFAAGSALADKDTFKGSKMIKEQLKKLTFTKGENGKQAGEYGIFSQQTTADASSKELKDLYDKCLVKTVNEVYKKMMKAHDSLLKAAHHAEKTIDKNVKGRVGFDEKDGKPGEYKSSTSKAKMIIKTLNAKVHTCISINSALFSAVYKTSVFALH